MESEAEEVEEEDARGFSKVRGERPLLGEILRFARPFRIFPGSRGDPRILATNRLFPRFVLREKSWRKLDVGSRLEPTIRCSLARFKRDSSK